MGPGPALRYGSQADRENRVRAVPKTWHLLAHDRMAVERLAAATRSAPVVAQLLLNRGIDEPEVARQFLNPALTGLHKPELLPGVTQAAERLWDAVRTGRRVCIYGDYDADGVTGTAILLQALRLLQAPVDFYVPHRLEEGYGLNADALRQIAASGATVVVTVDCGIGSVAEAAEAQRLGMELIITDHHEFKEELPAAAVLVHPRLPGSAYPFGGLSGAGVAFKLAWALCQRASGSEKVEARLRDFLLDSVVLAALGLIADVVPLRDENRIFVRHGLARLRAAPSIGLKALLESAGLGATGGLRADDVGFKLAPRINAVGRLGCARLVVELLTTVSPQRASDLARYLEGQNTDRQKIERRILAEARERVAQLDLESTPALVLADENWHAGVIGIVASRLVELYARPVLLIGLRGDKGASAPLGQGSGRSVPGFPLHEALHACREHLLSHGGHKAAAGFRIRPELIDAFREHFCACAGQHFAHKPPEPRLVLDAEVPLHALTLGLLDELDKLEPYGADNRRPLFLAGGLQIVNTPAKMGQGERHIHFRVRQQGTTLRAVGWGMAERIEELMSASGQCCLAFTPRINDWQGFRRVELDVQDLQPGPQARLV